jgi:hypothetical protein
MSSGKDGVDVIVAVGVMLAVGVMEGIGVIVAVGEIVAVGVIVLVGVDEGVGGMIRYTTSRPEIWIKRATIAKTKPTNSNLHPCDVRVRRSIKNGNFLADRICCHPDQIVAIIANTKIRTTNWTI